MHERLFCQSAVYMVIEGEIRKIRSCTFNTQLKKLLVQIKAYETQFGLSQNIIAFYSYERIIKVSIFCDR